MNVRQLSSDLLKTHKPTQPPTKTTNATEYKSTW